MAFFAYRFGNTFFSPRFVGGMALLFSVGLALGGCKSSAPGGRLDGSGSGENAKADLFPGGDIALTCPLGTDADRDGYGVGCKAGPDCDDADASVHPGAAERCDGIDNDCDTFIDENCGAGVEGPFPLTSGEDPGVQEATGVALDPQGDLILGSTKTTYNYMWIANSDDLDRGTISKIETVTMKEVARYFSVTCHSNPKAAGCVDLHGKPILVNETHDPSPTAVDTNFDVWV
ncbi:MAG: putative metal-binding motif-containing protein, partial [Deltaproteobacteria bacterium]|nr:putative metal-binding motif-containing protein [Deltaproteobacteria bacterium]